MKTKRFIASCAAALLAVAILLPVTGHAYDRSGAVVAVGYRDHYGDRHYRDDGHRSHYRHHHHHRHPPYGPTYGYYAPRYPAPYYYRPYYPSYYHPAPRYYGPDSGWSIDLHYFFRD